MVYRINRDPIIDNNRVLRVDRMRVGSFSQYSEPSPFAIGSTSGYTSGGIKTLPATMSNVIDKFPFSSDANASDVGDLFQARRTGGNASSGSNGYTAGGFSGSNFLDTIDKFPFASDGNASDVGNLSRAASSLGAGQSSSTNGYASGGTSGFSAVNFIEKYPFASDDNASNIADLTRVSSYSSGTSSETNGYTAGGGQSGNVIDKFPFASDDNATDVGDLLSDVRMGSGQNSKSHGYLSGGESYPPYGVPYSNVIQKWSFASDGNAADAADLSLARKEVCGQSSTANGYASGGDIGPPPGVVQNVVDKFPFASDANASDVGDLTQSRFNSAGQQV